LRWFEGPQDTSDLLRDILDIEAGSWKVAAGMDIPSRPMERRYHEQLLPMLSREGLLLANVLYIGGAPAAYNLCYRWNGRIGHLKTSFSNAFADLSPGAMAFEATLRRAHDEGAQEFDFLGAEMGHKLWWSTDARPHTTWLLCSRSLRGRWAGWLKRSIQASRALRTRFARRRGTASPETVDASQMPDSA
jgi:CelD/BcsL family acetyltransferase involved in cellulose biosynthesis